MGQDIVDKFSSHLKNVLTRALCFVVEINQKTIEPEHLLWALGTQKGSIGAEVLKKTGVKQTDLRKLIGSAKLSPKTINTDQQLALQLSDEAKRIVEKAVLTANVYGHRYVGTEHLLSGIIQANDGDIESFFHSISVEVKTIKSQLALVLKSATKFPELSEIIPAENGTKQDPSSTTKQESSTPDKMQALEYFARELTSVELQKDVNPVIGREQEIQRLMEILARRTKNNPLLVGEPGVGKTAIVEGLAKQILEGTVPPFLQNKRIFALDMALVVAGTMYRGEFESRLKQIIEEVKQNSDVILFIDELHTIVGAGSASGSMDAANMLKPSLARGEIRCIGATTPNEFKKQIESDSALERRFQPITVEEPSAEKAIEILHGIAPYYEAFHNVRIAPEAIEQAAKLSGRYIQNKQLPDKAIDIIDEASARVRIAHMQPGPTERKRQLERALQDLRERKRIAVMEERYDDAVALKDEEAVLKNNLAISTVLDEEAVVPVISARDVAGIIASATGIPLEQLLAESQEQARLIEDKLKTHIIGQDLAVETAAGALRRAKTGIAHPNRPLASLLFLGPSGVGKTELAKAIAKEFFLDEKHLIRLDMSEYSEGFTASKLIGAPAGYVGYKEQSNLTDRIKQKPYSLVLFDELEKSHRDVQNLLLQILEEGELTDATGRTINFRNTIVVMTSNVGLERFEQGGLGFIESDKMRTMGLNEDVRRELEERFRPELLNRIDHVCVFDPLSTEALKQIFDKQLLEMITRVKQNGVTLSVDKAVFGHLSKHLNPKHGARTIRQTIQKHIETRIAERLTKADRPKRLHVSLKGKNITVAKART